MDGTRNLAVLGQHATSQATRPELVKEHLGGAGRYVTSVWKQIWIRVLDSMLVFESS